MNKQQLRNLIEDNDHIDYDREEKFTQRSKSKKFKGKNKKIRREKRNRKRGYYDEH